MELLIPSALAILLSALSPFIVGMLTKASMSSKTKSLVAFGVSAVIAVAWLATTGGLGALTLAAGVPAFVQALGLAIGAAYTLQQAVHMFLFKGTELAGAVLANVGVTDGESDASGSGFDAEVEPVEEELGD